ncbi:hypothetical protein BLA24_05165 [Streptomyces cinnamoneus]|uniref:Uncharacterized protein n=1 Tax=Streptomyces cinnamoneus TaxID=53446 RepID=A0A2G1XP54_STRCJ|nr:hypothetical protein [Streptomyces cinnamoneus]PHQ52939.1 hypothetical protein BLA24_05165 [Streptomyces cinnamoneus]PPT11399.1 hypothetical protein CYQ11_28365 [Streptomyces cinnamoneus]
MSGPDTADHVSVHLTSCGHDDATAVFEALESAFPSGSKVRAVDTGAGAPTVWSTVVDARTRVAPGTTVPSPLGGAVTVDLFGAADPVRQVREELAAAFGVEDHGTVPGEHELETRLVLTAHPDHAPS